MAEEEVDIRYLQPLETSIESLGNVFGAETDIIQNSFAGKVELCADEKVTSSPKLWVFFR